MIVQVEISRVIISEFNQHQVIYLKEKDGPREFPVVIGIFEATTIDRRLRKIPSVRPMTHDLFRDMVKALGGTIRDMVIYRAEGQTFYAHLRIQKGEELILLDSRPSDAIAITLGEDPPLNIYVQEEVLQQVAQS